MNIFYNRLIKRFCRDTGISKSIPFEQIPADIRQILLYGTSYAEQKQYEISFEGVIPNLNRRWKSTTSEYVKERLHSYLSEQPCRSCSGARLCPEATAVTISGKNISQLSTLSIEKAQKFFNQLVLDNEKTIIASNRRLLSSFSSRNWSFEFLKYPKLKGRPFASATTISIDRRAIEWSGAITLIASSFSNSRAFRRDPE